MVVVLVVSNIAFGTLHVHVLDYKLFELLYPGRDLQVSGLWGSDTWFFHMFSPSRDLGYLDSSLVF